MNNFLRQSGDEEQYKGLPEGRECHYQDGLTAVVWDKLGTEFDFAAPSSEYAGSSVWAGPSIYSPGEMIALQVEMSGESTAMVVTDGSGIVVQFNTDSEGRELGTVLYDDKRAKEFIDQLASNPMIIGGRPDRLGGGKLVAVMGLAPHMHNLDTSSELVEQADSPFTRARIVWESAAEDLF